MQEVLHPGGVRADTEHVTDPVSSPAVPVRRRIDFALDDGAVTDWNPAAPEFVAAANGVSLMMPFVEPYFVGAVRQAVPGLDPDLAAVAEAFAHQEMQHQGEHRVFNRLLVGEVPALARVEGWMRRTYRWLGRTRSLRFNLAFAAASETIAYCLARWTSDHLSEFLRGADPPRRTCSCGTWPRRWSTSPWRSTSTTPWTAPARATPGPGPAPWRSWPGSTWWPP